MATKAKKKATEEGGGKRMSRRARQRLENPTRAKAMHAARLAREHEHRAAPAPPPEPVATPEIHVGCSGWFYWHWSGVFYPAGMSTSGWFRHYADRFDTVELNAPFYSWPTVETVKTWVRQVRGRDFVYAVKVNELITHTKRFTGTKTLVRDFGLIADLLGPRFGCFLFQMPPSFHYTPARLARIVGQLDPARRNVVEFRHASWWNDRVYDAFRGAGIVFCSCSGPGLPDELVKTADDVYVRFHGPARWYRHDYTKAELWEWAERVRGSGARRAWAYFNNDHQAHAVANAQELQRLLMQESHT